MEIIVSEEEERVPVQVFQIEGELTAETESQLVKRAQEAHQAGMRYLLLDLAQTSFVSSAGLRAIHQLYILLRADTSERGDSAVRNGIRAGSYHSSHLKLFAPKPSVLKVLQAAGFDMFLDIYTDRRAALTSF